MKIPLQDSLSIEVDVTQLLENAKAGDQLIIASGDGEKVYKGVLLI